MRLGLARTALAMALALASGAACALGLGQIEVKSRAGQPLLAEIPVITSNTDELAQLRAGLASPETFQRIGLEPPQGIVTDLRFTLAVDAAGKPVIRVTSTQPVQQPLLTFLIEVDWGQGRLTREYSALLDAPRTVSAPLQPPIKAPTGAAANTIERPLEAPLPFGAQPQETDPLSVDNQLDRYDPGAVGAAPAYPAYPPDPIALAPEPTPEPAPAPPPAAAADEPAPAPAAPARERGNAGRIERPVAAAPPPREAGPGDELVVARGQTLSGIAAGLGSGATLNQTMIALLRANPEAFIGGNINRLKQGAVLRLPPSDRLAAIDPREASELVRVQVQQWRQGSAPVPQPVGLETAVAQAPVAPAASGAAAGRAAQARLEIVPPGAERATQAGAQSGISAGGEGEMMRQEMQQTNETLAAREQEVAELKNKVAELERLQQDQQKLIAMKDTELAAAQQRLADGQARAEGGSPLPWLFGGLGALVLLIGGWVLSRREPKRPAFRAPPPSAGEAPAPAADPGAAAVAAAPATAAALADPAGALRRRPDPASVAAAAQHEAGHIAPEQVEPEQDTHRTAAGWNDPVAQLLAEPATAPTTPDMPEPAPAWTAPRHQAPAAARVPTWHSAEAGAAAAARRPEPTLAELARAESGRVESVRVESGRVESRPVEPGAVESVHVESVHVGSARTEPARTDPAEPARNDSLRASDEDAARHAQSPAEAGRPGYTLAEAPSQSAPASAVPLREAIAAAPPSPVPLRVAPVAVTAPVQAAAVAPTAAPASSAPTTDSAAADVAEGGEPVAAPLVAAEPNAAPGMERIELARAYLDLGDESSARQLLGEVLINGDHAARQQAARLLRELEASG